MHVEGGSGFPPGPAANQLGAPLLQVPSSRTPPGGSGAKSNSPNARRFDRERDHTVIIEPTIAFSVGNLDRLSRRAHVISFWANLALFIGKLFVYLECRSMAILASLVDSTIDLLAQGVLMWANRAVGNSDGIAYPAGRSRLEPVGVVTCALLMAMASLQARRAAPRHAAPRLGSGARAAARAGGGGLTA